MAKTTVTIDELQPGERKFIEVNGIEIAVLNVEGEYYAFQNFCPHMEGPVGRGPVGEDKCGNPTIDCPFHGWTFSLDDGSVSFGNLKRLTTYDIDVIDGDVRIEV